jgi:hypothetical protein
MPQGHSPILAFNRGILGKLALARADLARYAMSAEVMTNWMPRVLGSMSLRPGWQYISPTRNNAKAKTIDFIFSSTDVAQLELTDSVLRVRVNDVLITRPAVSAQTTNGSFNVDASGWTDSDESGATSAWATGGYLSLVGTGTNAAIRDQAVTVTETGTEHALRIVIARGTILFRVGSSSGNDDYVTETTLGVGTHSLAFTPTGNINIRVMNRAIAASLVDSITVEAAGILEVPTPWREASLGSIRRVQSGDVMYLAAKGYQQRKIERRGVHSWSVVLYQPTTGPFRLSNITPTTIAPSALTGDITLTASKALFKAAHVGALFRLRSSGQIATAAITGANQFTDSIEVTGVGGQRAFSILITGTFVGTFTLQYSLSAPGNWVDAKTYTTPQAISYNDQLDNQIIFYRVGIKAGDYTSGSATATLSFSSGSSTGIVRVTAFTDQTHVSAAVLDALGGVDATSDWTEGSWSDFRGWPSAVVLHEGRLWWLGLSVYGSVSDDYENFDDSIEGDSGTIQRSIGEGPIDAINWALSLNRLLLGTPSAETSARSSSFDEPLTPTNFNLKASSTQGSSTVDAVRKDKDGIYAQRSCQRVFELSYDLNSNDYVSNDLTLLTPDLHKAGLVHIAIQRQPDTRIHCVRADGTVGILIFDKAENVTCWLEITTSGAVEDVSVLPGTSEDRIYYVVRRTINGQAVRYLEKWALESECTGLPMAKLADAHFMYSGAPTQTISGLDHLEGQQVYGWGWNTQTPFVGGNGLTAGFDLLGPHLVTNGAITNLPSAVTDACIGLGYTAQWKSMKQAFAAALGTPLSQRKRVNAAALILLNTHAQGIQIGSDFDHLDDIPLDELPRTLGNDDQIDTNVVLAELDYDLAPFNDIWSTDSRICLQAKAPRPCTALCVTVEMTTSG